jgi:uncharacterized protein YukE
VPAEEFGADPAGLRAAARQVAGWSERLAEESSGVTGALPRALDDLGLSFEGAAVGEAAEAVSVAVARAADGLVTALRGLGDGLEDASDRYAAVDRSAAEGFGEPPR